MINSVGFTGTQKGMTTEQYSLVTQLLTNDLQPTHVHHGDCIGADAEFHDIAMHLKGLHDDVPIIHIHPPTDPKKRAYCIGDVNYSPHSYLKRNRAIVAMSDVLIATPKEKHEQVIGSGTWATIRYARKKGIPIYIVCFDGELVFHPGNAAGGALSAKSGLTSQG